MYNTIIKDYFALDNAKNVADHLNTVLRLAEDNPEWKEYTKNYRLSIVFTVEKLIELIHDLEKTNLEHEYQEKIDALQVQINELSEHVMQLAEQ